MPTWLVPRVVAFATLCAFGMQPIVAHAQATLPMTPDRSGSNHPVVGVSASGVPLVNIVAPNEAGVSLNNFTNYNVGTQGAVVVNTPRSAQTQIAGWVQGNPLMGNAPARLIINQVTSGNPTRLLGMTEIAGNRANLVIANPAGITCAGCGFINVPRVSLATALPAFNADGSLAGFDVARGRLGVTGGGLDARGSAIDLIARAMQINGQVWADSITATAGASQVNYADGAAVSKPGDSQKPGVAIDVQALGGMYANSVRLIGTEAGVGVRHSGDISSLTGAIELSAKGDVTIEPTGRIQAAGPIRVDAPNLANAGMITSRQAVGLSAEDSLRNDGLVAAQFNVGLAARNVANGGAVIAGVNTLDAPSGPGSVTLTGINLSSSGTLAAGDNVNVTGTTVSLEGGDVFAASALNLTGDQSISTSGVTATATNATLKTNGTFINDGGSVHVVSNMKIDARSVSNRSDGAVVAQALAVDAEHIDNSGGYLLGRERAQIQAADLANDAGHIGSVDGAVHVAVKGALSNAGGELAGGSELSLDAQHLISNRGGRVSTVAGDASIHIDGRADNEQGLIASAGQLLIDSAALNNAHGQIDSAQVLTMAVEGELANHHGLIVANDDLALQTHAIDNTNGVLETSVGKLAVRNGGDLANDQGRIVGARGLDITTDRITGNAVGAIGTLAGDASLTAGGAVTNTGGTIASAGKLSVNSAALDNRGGAMRGHQATLTVASLNNNDGRILSDTDMRLHSAGELANSDGTIVANEALTVRAGSLTENRAGQIGTTTGDAEIVFQSNARNDGGVVASAGDLRLHARSLSNREGGGVYGKTATVSAAELQNDSGKIRSRGGAVNVSVAGALSSENGRIVGANGSTVSAGALTNHRNGQIGTVAGDTTLTFARDADNAHGMIASAGHLNVTSQALDNTSGRVYADAAQISTSDLANTDGVIESRAGSMDLKASGSVSNARGSVVGAKGMNFEAVSIASNELGQIGALTGTARINVASELSNAGGTLGAGGTLTIRADHFDNASGSTLGDAIDITADRDIKNTNGRITSTQETNVKSEKLSSNHEGVIGSHQGPLNVATTGITVNEGGKLLAAGDVTLTSAGLINTDGIVSGARVTLSNGTGYIDNTRGVIDAAARLDTDSGSLDNRSGLIQSGGAAALDAHGGLFDNRAAAGMQAGGRVIGRGVALTTGALENSAGLISASDTTHVSAQSVANENGAILSHQTLKLESVGALSNVAGQIGGEADVMLKGTTVDNTRGAVHAGQALVVTGDEIVNTQTKEATPATVSDMPLLQAGMEGANVSLTATTHIDNTAGSIRSDREAILVTPVVDNTDGAITSAKRVSIAADATVKNTRGEINGGQRVDLSAAVLSNDGRIESRGDVSANVRGDLTNIGAIIAGHNLDVTTQGNVHNSGTMNAQNVTTVSGQRIDNASGGEIKGDYGTYVHAGQSVSNEGLIDGSATRVDAADTLTNEGRIYGDSVSLGGQIVCNGANAQGVGAAIASRGDIDIGAKVIENQGESLVYASNDIRTGRSLDANGRASDGLSDRFTNNGSVVDAGGDLKIATKRFENLNSNFQTQKVTTDAGKQIWYTTPGSTERFDASSVYFYHRGSHEAVPGTDYQWALDDDQKFLLLPSKRYPFAEYAEYTMNGVAGKAGSIRYAPPPRMNGDDDFVVRRDADLVGVFREIPDEMWTRFGVTPPPPPPDPRYIKAGSYKVHTLFERRDLGPEWYSLNVPMAMVPNPDGPGKKPESCITAAADHCKPFKEWYDRLSQAYVSLGGALYAYNNDVASRTIQRWTIYDVNVQSTKDVVTATQPGMITAAGSVTIDAETGINDKSQILAGGRAYLNKAIQDNSQPKGVETFTGSGEATTTWVSGRRFRGDERKWESAPYVLAIPSREIDLPVARVAPTNQEPVKRVTADASAARGVSGTSVIGAPMPAIEGLTEAAPGISAGQDRTVTTSTGTAGLSVRDGQVQARANAALAAGNAGRVEAGAGADVAATTGAANSALLGERPASEMSLNHRAPPNPVPRAKLGPIEIRTVEPNLTVPGNALYQVVPDPGSRYLVETDARFTNQRYWLSSETMIAALGTNPGSVQKRLGDGFYEQQLVQQQIMQATGQRYVGDYTDNRTQYQALLANGVKAAKRFEMNVGTALTDAQMAALTDDIVWLVNHEVTLADGTQQSVLVPQVYLRAHAADVTGTGSIISADSVVLNNKETLTNSGTMASRRATIITADSITNVGAIAGQTVRAEAKEDLKNLGGLIQGDTVQLTAGRDVNLSSTTSSATTQNGSATVIDRVASINAGKLAVQAGRDLNLDAAQIASSGDAVLLAQRDVNLAAIRERSDDHVRWDDKNRADHNASIDTATSVVSEGKIAIAAGRDLNATAASVSAQGSLTALAARDINLDAGEQSASAYDEHHVKERGVLSSKSTHTIDASRYTDAIGTTFSGETVNISAGNNLTARAATIAGTGDVTLEAGHDLRIATGDTASHESHFKDVRKSGLGSAGAGISYGKSQTTDTSLDQMNGSRGSLIGSIEGSVSLRAGNKLRVTGSDFVAAHDVTGAAKEVKFDASQTNRHYEETHETKSSIISLGVKSPAIDAIQNVNRQAQGAAKSQDGRAAALHGIAAAGGVADLADVAKGMTNAPNAGKTPEGKIELSVGSSHSKSTFVSDSTQHNGSTVKAGGTVQFVATGDKSAGQGNVTIEGSDVIAKDVRLMAADKVNLLSSTDTERTRSANDSKSASVGVSVGTGGVGVSASTARAHGDGNSDTQMRNNSHIVASNTATIVSGGDTTLAGANIRARKVDGDIGGNLNIESVQDMMQSAARQSSVGAGLNVSTGGGSASLSLQRGRASGEFAGVIEQSGIQAGDGGFDITVKGNTDLTGAYIASTAEPAKNRLTTGTLSYSDIANHSGYRASTGGISAGGGVGDGGNNYATHGPTTGKNKNPGGVSPVGVTESGHSEAVTKSAISAGSITIVDEANQKQDVALLSRDTTNLNGTVQALPDLQKALANQADLIDAAQAAGEATAKQIGRYAQTKQRQAADAAAKETDPQLKAQHMQEAMDWAEGGKYRAGMHIASGALTGGLTGGGAGAIGGAAGAGLSAMLAPKFDEFARSIKEAQPTGNGDVDALLGNLTSNLLAGGAGALVGGSTGALASAVTDRFNRQLHPDEKRWINEKEASYAKKYGLTPEQARDELTTQANLQVQNGSPGQWNQRAAEFLRQAHGMLPADGSSGPGYMFYATPDQKANPKMYEGYYAHGEGLNQPKPGDIAKSVGRENAYRDAFTKGTWGAAGGAATIALAGPIAVIPGAPIFGANGALGSSALASPIGTGAISATVNAGAQYLQNGKINPVDVGGAFVTGAAGSYGGLLWNMGVNTLGGATTTALNNILHGKRDSIVGAGITSGGLSIVGYSTAKLAESWINTSLRPTVNSSTGWADTGVWSGSGWNLLRPNSMAVIGGSVGGGAGQGAVGPILPSPSSEGNRK